MCGIFACYRHPDVQKFKPTALKLSKQIRHRGPDWSGSIISNNTSRSIGRRKTSSRLPSLTSAAVLCHERLSIVGVDSGAQPLTNADESLVLAVNGEIYNHRHIRKHLKEKYHFKTHSDCEVIIPLAEEEGRGGRGGESLAHVADESQYTEFDVDAPSHLDGMFSFVLYDKTQDRVIAARDPIGVTTFYQGWSWKEPGTIYFASELKCLHSVCDKIVAFPPGHVYDSKTGQTTRYFKPSWWDPTQVPSTPLNLQSIRQALEKSVRKRLMAEVPYGVLLSGGLDSSLVAAIAQRETLRLKQQALEANRSAARAADEDRGEGLVGIDDDNNLETVTYLPQLNSFSIGLPGSPDNVAALEVAKFLGTKHHVMTFTIEDGLNALSDVIYHLETYDVTTIRASTPMYLLSRKIKAMGVKMVLSGEGSDEIFGGYLYFHAAPDKNSFHEETVRRVKNLHLADCLRANKSTSAWGLEARVPFLDKEVSGLFPFPRLLVPRLLVPRLLVPRLLLIPRLLVPRLLVPRLLLIPRLLVPRLLLPDSSPPTPRLCLVTVTSLTASTHQFLETCMAIDPQEKMITKERMEKYILRKAFDTTDEPDNKPYLPESILWRQKEQFSDGVGYGWIDALKDHADLHVTDEMMANPKPEWGTDVPDTKEAYWYRLMFDEHFPPSCASTVMRWAPTWSRQTDPSGRFVPPAADAFDGTEADALIDAGPFPPTSPSTTPPPEPRRTRTSVGVPASVPAPDLFALHDQTIHTADLVSFVDGVLCVPRCWRRIYRMDMFETCRVHSHAPEHDAFDERLWNGSVRLCQSRPDAAVPIGSLLLPAWETRRQREPSRRPTHMAGRKSVAGSLRGTWFDGPRKGVMRAQAPSPGLLRTPPPREDDDGFVRVPTSQHPRLRASCYGFAYQPTRSSDGGTGTFYAVPPRDGTAPPRGTGTTAGGCPPNTTRGRQPIDDPCQNISLLASLEPPKLRGLKLSLLHITDRSLAAEARTFVSKSSKMSIPAFADIAKPANDVGPVLPSPPSDRRGQTLVKQRGTAGVPSSSTACSAVMPTPSSPLPSSPLPPHFLLPSPDRLSLPHAPCDGLLNKDFYHLSATTFEFKDTAPNGVAFKVTGKSSHEKATSAAIEGKYTDKPTGTAPTRPPRPRRPPSGGRRPAASKPSELSLCVSRIHGRRAGWPLDFAALIDPGHAHLLMWYRRTGLTLTQTWNTANALDTKLEVNDSLAKGLKLEGLFNFLPATAAKGAKFNMMFKQPGFHGRAFFDLLKGPTAHVDAVVGHEGFLAGASAGYDVNKAAVTAYSAAVGYTAPQYSAAVTATDNLSVFAASYYHKVNSQVEAGAKATWNSKTGNTVGLEVASKYRIDPVSFAKVKINDRGIAALAYNVLLREGVTLGLGGSFDTQKLDQATHKLGASFTFEG
ncbi:asparagine synthetase [Drechmeria coniospora]|uniref:asparagine synthase (glutamine-hydrolyzing) n=1 Tax=Drechmeria coniospora TaxID=98403 RepID=A0A151GML0_DRECN|nr:asparagine synthetase [Drechmeria coniospora]KYK58336.1 asparagine synthetase [Drechmeria coniospora]